MSTKELLSATLKDAMRSNDDVTKRTVRMVLASIKMAEIEKRIGLDESAIQGILQKEIKMRNESLDAAIQINREDLIADARAEILVLEKFIPKQLTDAELTVIVQQSIEELGAKSKADMGKVIKSVMIKAKGQAAGDKISKIVKDLLQ